MPAGGTDDKQRQKFVSWLNGLTVRAADDNLDFEDESLTKLSSPPEVVLPYLLRNASFFDLTRDGWVRG